MKKILSMGLAVTMAMAAMPVAYAADYTQGTQVEYIANADANREYTITVPAKMTPKLGEAVTGTVTLSGSWASNETVKVTADEKVVLTNSINPLDTHELAVNLPVMEYAGDNTEAKTYTGTVTLAEMPAAALFGEWTGKFNYNVEFGDGLEHMELAMQPSADFPVTYQSITFEEGMTWREWLNSSYKDPTALLVDFEPYPNTISIGLRFVIDKNNKFVSPDAVIDPNAHYELFLKNGDQIYSPTFGAVEPTWP